MDLAMAWQTLELKSSRNWSSSTADETLAAAFPFDCFQLIVHVFLYFQQTTVEPSCVIALLTHGQTSPISLNSPER